MGELTISEYMISFSDLQAIFFTMPFALNEPVADDFTIEEFAAWARTKPAAERYDFKDDRNCALAQFGMATDRAHLVGTRGTELLYRRPELYRMLSKAGTFGMLARCLDTLAAEQKMKAIRGPSPRFPQRRAGYVADGGSQWVKPEAYLTDMVLEPA